MAIREDLLLDVSAAQRSVAALERQISAAVGTIPIDIDTSSIAGELDRALSHASSGVTVPVNVDTAGVVAEVDHAVDAADTRVDITADTDPAQREVRDLRREVDATERSSDRLGTTLRRVFTITIVAGAARGLLGLADAASSVNEQISGSVVVFDSAAPAVQRFADQAERIGLSEADALRAANAFGQLAQSAGLLDSEAAPFATGILERAADIASLRDLDLTQVLEALRSGLVGETEPLRNLGIFLNEAVVSAKAMELGLASATGEVTDAAKIQARYQLIMEQSTIAQGDFARTSDGLANSQRIFAAEAKNTAAAVGQSILPQFQGLVGAGRDLLPVLGEFGTRTLPPLLSIFTSLAPVVGSFFTILTVGAPIIEAVAGALDAIPDPLLIIAGTGVLAGKAFGGIDRSLTLLLPALSSLPGILSGTASALPASVSGVGRLGGGLQKMAGALATANPLVIAGGIGVGLLAVHLFNAAERERRFQAEVKEATEALRDQDGQVRVSTAGIVDYIENNSRFEAHNQIDDLHRLGLGFGDLADLVNRGARSLDEFIDRAIAAGEVEVVPDRIDTGEKTLVVNGRRLKGNTDLIKSFRELLKVENEAAQQQIDLLRVSGDLPQATIDTAVANSTAADGTVNYVVALRKLNGELGLLQKQQEAAAASTQRVRELYDPLVATLTHTGDALGRLSSENSNVAGVIASMRVSAGGTDRSFLDLALSIDQASLSKEGFADAAALLGTDVESLQGFVDGATGALDDFVAAATAGLPTVSDVLRNLRSDLADAAAAATVEGPDASSIERASIAVDRARQRLAATNTRVDEAKTDTEIADARLDARDAALDLADAEQRLADSQAGAQPAAAVAEVSATQLADGLRAQAESLADFRSDLAAIEAAGFADVAGLIAQQGAEGGNALADELADALASGNTELLTGLSDANKIFETELQSTNDFMRNVLGPELILTAGLLGTSISDTFGTNLNFEERLRISSEVGALALDEGGKAVAAVAAVEGEAAARAYGKALDLEQATIDAGVAAGVAIGTNAPVDQAAAAGTATGEAFADGVAEGVASKTDVLVAAATFAVEEVDKAVRFKAGIASPSKLMTEIGRFLMDGLALGITTGTAGAATSAGAAVGQLGATFAAGRFEVRPDVAARAGGSSQPFLGRDQARMIAEELARVLPASALIGQFIHHAAGGDNGDGMVERLRGMAWRLGH